MVAATLELRDLQDGVRASRDLGAVVSLVTREAEVELDTLVRDFARPVLDQPDSTAALFHARTLAPAFLRSAIRLAPLLLGNGGLASETRAGLQARVDAMVQGSAGARHAAACCRDALFLWTGVGPWAQHAKFDELDELAEFVSRAALSDLLLFVAYVGLAGGDFERRPELAELARHAWDHVVQRYWATLELVLDHVDDAVLKQFFQINWRRGQERRDRLVKAGVALTVEREAWEYWGDELIGGYLERAIAKTAERLPGADLELERTEDPETDDVSLVLRIHVQGLGTPEAIEAERGLMMATTAELPDCLVGSLIVDLRLDE